MSTGYTVRRAADDDADAIMTIFQGRRDWLRQTIGSDQWASVSEWRHLISYLIRRGHVRVLISESNGKVAGTVTAGTDPDRDFWSDEERRIPALYISKLATDVRLRGQELGARLLSWAARYASSQGIGVLRLDTWKTSDGLRDYYAERGWLHIRTVDLAHRASGSLFEQKVDVSLTIRDGLGPDTVGTPTGEFAVLLQRLDPNGRS